ncbi:MAG: Hpt domain-containing protein [Parvularculaceae bacterium]|nr:Hpt domain-containing protein [Parvularculaceae bacterium]
MDTRSTFQTSLIELEQIDSLLEAAGVDGVRDILAAFWRSTDDLSAELVRCIDKGECVPAGRTAHAIKGSAANVGAHQLAISAREVEGYARIGDLSAARSAIERLMTIYRQTRAELDCYVASRPSRIKSSDHQGRD